jgi:hypothetical protein
MARDQPNQTRWLNHMNSEKPLRKRVQKRGRSKSKRDQHFRTTPNAPALQTNSDSKDSSGTNHNILTPGEALPDIESRACTAWPK